MVIGVDNEQDKANGFRVTEKGVVLVTPDMLGQSTHEYR
jgi:glucose-1-phosphate adenylyltransferase